MRDAQRDALVAYIIQQLGDRPATADINTPDKLFEYFLMDVQMESCMQTSRIRHALSSVQLFTERCLRNLEPLVAPSDIAASTWEVMKRYRLWQANLEVFLWPERWLYPELRDNQSPFFQSTTKQLLQSDITDDAAAQAYLDYLTQLESVAKLEPCAMHYSPADPSKPPGQDGEFAHVISRTCGANATYYYRQLTGGTWSPWQDTKLSIDGTPMALFLWNGRLLVFWLRIHAQQSPPSAPTTPPQGPDANHPSLANMTHEQILAAVQNTAAQQIKVPVYAVLCWSEYYNGKWQLTKTSDVSNPTCIGTFPMMGPEQFDRTTYQLQVASYSPDKLIVSIRPSGSSFSSDPPGFLLYNTHSVPPALENVAENPNWGSKNWRIFGTRFTNSGGNVDPNIAYPPPPGSGPNTFSIGYFKQVAKPKPHTVQASANDILSSTVGEGILAPQALV
jgi:hypothetical protein